MVSFYGFVYNPALSADITGTSGATVSPQSYISGNASSAKFSFGYMSYSKGGCLNKMFANYLGADNWNKGNIHSKPLVKFTCLMLARNRVSIANQHS